MSQSQTNQPKARIRDGLMEAAIWENPKQDGEGVRHSAEFSRSYRDSKGDWHSSSTFSNGELLRLARLAEKAYDKIGELRAEARDDQ